MPKIISRISILKKILIFVSLSVSQLSAQVPILVDTFGVADFTGTSSASGTIIEITNNSMVNFLGQSTAGNASISLDSTSQLDFGQTIATTYSGQITGSGAIIKSGAGNLTMTGDNSLFTGPLFVQTGTLVLNGSYGGSVTGTAQSVIVYGGAITGNLNVTSNGTITTQGVTALQVGGNFTQASSATYIVQVNSSGKSSLINAAGTGSVGGFLKVNIFEGSLLLEKYTVLHAAGGLSGIYQLVNPYQGLNIMESQDLFNVYLNFLGVNLTPFANTPNEEAVASQLQDLVDPSGDAAYVLGAIALLDPTEIQNGLNLLSGEQYSNFILAAMYGNERFSTTLFNAYRGLINPCLNHCPGIHSWINGGGGRGFQSGNSNAQGFNLTNYDVSTGVHSLIGDSWLLGAALGYEIDYIHSKLAGHSTLQTGQAGVYTAFQTNHLYVLSDLIVGKGWSTYKRPISFALFDRTAKSKPQINRGRFDLQIGTDFGNCNFLVQPFIAGGAEVYNQNKLKETGASAMNLMVQTKTKWLATNQIGFHLNTTVIPKLVVNFDLSWEHYYGNLKVSEKTKFVEFGNSFTITGAKRSHDGILGSLYISTPKNRCWNLYLESSGEIWRKWKAFEFNGGLSYRW